ncbi:mitochondrial sodium/calcium exchanger protein-like [Schistocerca serialis cubense]|uniref:mitochondrial sodium/calcium exchanger protein-like n=1 Tax=Schistocerca serialis cubense TaxID=2023355 RepID=UPI00214EF7E8|nr:mitochondrial sodium/calcium exchanger protein-like [Schistocerca serialis cubense]
MFSKLNHLRDVTGYTTQQLAGILAVLFIILATTADEFFCKSIDLVAKVLHLSEHIAAVTILAFGNGSADIFTSLAGALSGHSELVFAELLGSGILITTVVVGIICIMNPIYLFGRPFLRDSIFYIIAITWIICAFSKKFATTWETSGFLILYVLYFLVVLTDRAVRKSLIDRVSAMTPEERRLIEAFQNSSDNLNREEEESQNDTRAV